VFISFEGIEASGKSTVMAAVKRALLAQGTEVVTSIEPGGTPAGEAIRGVFLKPGTNLLPVTELLLINASRAQLVAEVIQPALARGAAVLVDRYVHSTIAYQGHGRGLPLELVQTVCNAATGGLMPDLTLLMDVTLETSGRRIAARGEVVDRMEQEGMAFHQRVRRGFLEMAAHDDRVVAINGERSPEEVADAAMAALSALLTA
jgi:dTMP kinase